MKTIPCNDYLCTAKAKRDRIVYRFVTEDRNTPSSCVVRVGDIDPLTGEAVTSPVIREYYREVDHQVYIQNKETRDMLYMDGILDDEGDKKLERKSRFSTPLADPFGEDEPEDVLRLKEFAASLTGRMADVYETLLVKHAGGKAKINQKRLSAKWGVDPAQIIYDQKKIIRMIKRVMADE